MNDLIPNYNVPVYNARIYGDTAGKKLSPSLYWAITVAILLHALAIFYLVQQNFVMPADKGAVVPEQPPVIMTMDRPQPPNQTAKPVNLIVVHTPPLINQTPDTTPITPVKTETPTTTGQPPTIITTPVTPQGPTTTQPAYVTAHWARFPDSAALTQYYPSRAIDAEMEGTATVQCTVLDSAGRVSCSVVSETPGNYGFGAATVKMVETKGRVDTTQGDIKIGSVLRTTVQWQLG